MEWRVMNLGKISLATALAMNDATIEAVRDGSVPPTISILRITPSAVSLGTFQSVSTDINADRCRELGIDIVRRQSGGGAVFDDANGEVQYAVVAPDDMFPNDILDGYRVVCGWVIDGLLGIGIKADFVPLNDIAVNGKKISGNAQTRKDGVFSQHGTVLYKVDFKTMFSVLNVSKEKISDKAIKSAEERVMGISSISGVSIDELGLAVLKGLTNGKQYRMGKLVKSEAQRAQSLYNNFYKSDRWTFKR